MRYHYTPQRTGLTAGEVYKCDHELYSYCTLFRCGGRGLAVIQKRFNRKLKVTWWDCLDSALAYDISIQQGFAQYLDEHAGVPVNGLYPTIPVRKVMWALRMKPLRKETWE